ncbi:T9SS type A sorting domain-containing protein [Flammeovirga kamogawensis]|uniref:T9SS type A sorting domain-containing protein n=1 Tax=Flammeovirga kamogawensis TaxID=373891 RepID=A0ABX8GYD2_9BACT|nr:T9SS type A sorting domain-containing protein [Flammeovirga kamogawensis]MBB6459057.1 hypothetical protein [Flammeovirga kamogawensis]QWG08626.1 T9SS type A sorting domain-containing protein [Flammeovirga kamogawensis]TRX66919.1 T9SS type A sorting domain-containing protein [Flammeovirga kamogawensis]
MNVSKLKKQLLCLSCLLLLSFQSFADTFSSELLTDRVNVYWNTSMQVTFRYRISEGIWQEISYEYDDNNKPNGKTIGEGDGLAPGTRIDIKLSSTNIWIGDYERTYYVATTPSHAYASIHDDRIVVQWDENRYGGTPIDIRYRKSGENWKHLFNQTSGHIDLSQNGFSPGEVEVEYKFTNNDWSSAKKQSFTISNPGADFITVHKVEDRISVIWPSNKYGGSINLKYLIKDTNESNYRLMQTSGNIDLTPTNGFAPGDIDISYSFGINGSYEGNKQTVTISIADLITFTPIGDKLEINWPSYISNGNRFGGGTSFDFEFSDVSLLSQDVSPVEYRPANGFTPKEYEISYKYTSLNSWKKKTVRFTPNWTEFISVNVDGFEIVVDDWKNGTWGNSDLDFRFKETSENQWHQSNYSDMSSGFSFGQYHIDGLPSGVYDIQVKVPSSNDWNSLSQYSISHRDVALESISFEEEEDFILAKWNTSHYPLTTMDIRYRTAQEFTDNYSDWNYINDQSSGRVKIRPNNGFAPRTLMQIQVKFNATTTWPILREEHKTIASRKPTHYSAVMSGGIITITWNDRNSDGQIMYDGQPLARGTVNYTCGWGCSGSSPMILYGADPTNSQIENRKIIFDNYISGTITDIEIWWDYNGLADNSFDEFYTRNDRRCTIPLSNSSFRENNLQDEIGIENIFNFYPNPLVDQSTLEFNLGDQLEYEIKVYDLTGSVVHSKKGIGQNGINKLIIDKSDFSSKGIHIIELRSGKEIQRKKIIRN